MKQRFEDNFFYMLYFQTPGVAEHELQKDVRRTLRMLLYSASGTGIENAFPASPENGGLPRSDGRTRSVARTGLPRKTSTTSPASSCAPDFRGGLNWYRNIDRNVGALPRRSLANASNSRPCSSPATGT